MKIRIKHILRCYQSGMSIRSISSSLLISRNTVKRYIRIPVGGIKIAHI